MHAAGAVAPAAGAGPRSTTRSEIAGVVTSYPQGACLRVVADPLAERDLRRFAAMHAASLSRADARLEDSVLARSLSMRSRQT